MCSPAFPAQYIRVSCVVLSSLLVPPGEGAGPSGGGVYTGGGVQYLQRGGGRIGPRAGRPQRPSQKRQRRYRSSPTDERTVFL